MLRLSGGTCHTYLHAFGPKRSPSPAGLPPGARPQNPTSACPMLCEHVEQALPTARAPLEVKRDKARGDGPDPTKLPTAGSPASTGNGLRASTGLLSGRDPTSEPQNPTAEPRDPTAVPSPQRCFGSGERSGARGWEMNPPTHTTGNALGSGGIPRTPLPRGLHRKESDMPWAPPLGASRLRGSPAPADGQPR